MDRLKLEYLIKSRNMTIDEFCKKIGVSKSAFYRKCNGQSEFKLSEIRMITEILKIKISDTEDIFFKKEVSKGHHDGGTYGKRN